MIKSSLTIILSPYSRIFPTLPSKTGKCCIPCWRSWERRGYHTDESFPSPTMPHTKASNSTCHSEDIPAFCEQLILSLIDLPEWYQEFRISTLGTAIPHSPQASPSKPPSSKKSKFNKRTGLNYGTSPYSAKGFRFQDSTWATGINVIQFFLFCGCCLQMKICSTCFTRTLVKVTFGIIF